MSAILFVILVFAYTAKEEIIGEWLKENINIGIIIQIAIKIPRKTMIVLNALLQYLNIPIWNHP